MRKKGYFGIYAPHDLLQDGDNRWAWQAPRSFICSWLMVIAIEALYAIWRLTFKSSDEECKRLHDKSERMLMATKDADEQE